METTWNVMSQYLNMMLMAVFYNIGILLALAFGPEEINELYSLVYTSFFEPFQVDVSNHIFESDPRSAPDTTAHDHHRRAGI
jgi:hypothetical protein